jgi:hypothetical protein
MKSVILTLTLAAGATVAHAHIVLENNKGTPPGLVEEDVFPVAQCIAVAWSTGVCSENRLSPLGSRWHHHR